MPSGSSAFDISYRSRKILYAVVTEYVATGEPVGSRKLARRYGLNLSPATIRNVLADLEEAGFVVQPHTSAGRVPTDAGFRVFVDALAHMRELAAEDRAAVVARLQALKAEGADLSREAGRMLASLTGAAAVVTPPKLEREVLSHLRFLPLREGQLLAVLVSRSGSVENRIVPYDGELDAAELERVHNYLAELLQGRSLGEVRQELANQMEDHRGSYNQLRKHAKSMVDAAVASSEDRHEVLIEGQGELFGRPEFSDVEKVRGYLRTFEEKERLLQLLDRTLAIGGVQVLIGSEANLSPLEDVSVVSAIYGPHRQAAGTLGVIGPTRMDYGKVVPLVTYTAQVMGELLDDESEEEPEPEHGP